MHHVVRLLFVCRSAGTHSVLCEAILNHLAPRCVRGYSAGSHPSGEVDPDVLRLLADRGIAADGARSKSWYEFAGPYALPMHAIVTVRPEVVATPAPPWPGEPALVNWTTADAHRNAVADADIDRQVVLERWFQTSYRRISALADLPLASMSAAERAAALRSLA